MKRIVIILFLMMLVMSCSDITKVKMELDDAESFLQTSPDSSLSIIREIEPGDLSRPNLRARYSLLYSLALDKNYIDITEDSLARDAVNYYSNSRDSYHAMLSWYSLGRVQMNAENYSNAIVSYLEAENLAESIPDLHYQGLILRNIGQLYSNQNDTEEALKYYLQSAAAFDSIGKDNYAVYSKYPAALAYHSLGKGVECDSLFVILEQYCSETKDQYLSNLIASARGTFALLDNEENAAYAIQSIKSGNKYRLRSQEAGYLMLAYACLGQSDSSDYYRRMAFQEAKTPLDSGRLYMLVSRTAEKGGDYETALEYQGMAYAVQDRLMNRRESMFISNSLSNYHQLKMAGAEASLYRSRVLFWMVSLFSLLLLLFLLQRLKIRSLQNREKDRMIAEKEARIQDDLAKTEEILSEIQDLKKDKDSILSTLASSVLEQMSMVNKWAEAYHGVLKEEKDPNRHLDADAFGKKEDIVRHFCESLESVRNDELWFSQIEESVNLYKDGLMAKVRKVCNQPHQKKQPMSESDYRTLLLMFSGLPDKAISYFQGLSYGAVRMRRVRYRDYFSRLPAEESSLFLNALS